MSAGLRGGRSLDQRGIDPQNIHLYTASTASTVCWFPLLSEIAVSYSTLPSMSAIAPKETPQSEVIGEKSDGAILAPTETTNENTPQGEDASTYLHGWSLWYLAMALMSSAFVISLDNTILGNYLRNHKLTISN